MFETYPDNMEIMFGHGLSIIIMYVYASYSFERFFVILINHYHGLKEKHRN